MVWSSLLFTIWRAGAQATYTVQDFSDRYTAEVYLEDPGAVFSPGWVAVYHKQTGEQLVRVESDDLAADIADGKVEANVVQRPYGKQSVLIYEDFNFDGEKDLAISDGNHSCYGGPSYQIYLAQEGRFSYSEDFTRLAQEFCGMFAVNPSEQTLETMTKEGCCWHQFSTYAIKEDKPYLIRRVEEGHSYTEPYWEYTVHQREKDSLVTASYHVLDKGGFVGEDGAFNADLLLYFQFEKGKQMFLFRDQTMGKIFYAFTDKEDKIELLYSGKMDWNEKENGIEFRNKQAVYTLFKDKLKVQVDAKTYLFQPLRKEGSLQRFLEIKED